MDIVIREYKESDIKALSALFYRTVHEVNCADYGKEQLRAWAPSPSVLEGRGKELSRMQTLVAETGGKIAGFGCIDQSGYLDLLYVSKDFLRRGVASAICDRLEAGKGRVFTYASITAKPFFESRGYLTVKENTVIRRGVALKNFLMQKTCVAEAPPKD